MGKVLEKPQRIEVFDYMIKFGGITHLESVIELGIINLPGRIYDLRKEGVKVDKERIKYKNKAGKRKFYDRYFVAADNQVIPSY